MADTTIDAKKYIFEQALDDVDIQAVNALVNQHKGNAALTQQLALDASRLLSTSQERLDKQVGAGFFNRFVGKLTGKNSENQLKNQVDMLQMQKYAWHYLKQLQQQNLINSQSIAVIRNNLGTMNEYIIETRDFIEQVIDKIHSRLVHVENNTNFNTWSLHIEANKRRFKSIPRNLLMLHLTYDFMRKHRDVVLTSRDLNYLVVTLEKLDINCDEEVQLLGFIIELIKQIKITGIERYREMIELALDEHIVDAHFIQKNISGMAFNALYFLSEQYEKIIDLTEGSELCRTDTDREVLISKLFGREFSGLSTTYSFRDLIGEVIGGSALAMDIYKEVHGLNILPSEGDDVEQPETWSLMPSLPDIQAHTFFDSKVSDEERRNYLRLFVLAIDGSSALNSAGLEFLALLAEKAGCPEMCREIVSLADSPSKFQDYLPVMRALLSDDDKAYTWLIDALFLLLLCQKKIENPQVTRILNTLKPAQFRENLPRLLVLLNESEPAPVLEAAEKLASQSRGWKNIIRYRALRFDQVYAQTESQLNAASNAVTQLKLSLLDVYLKASNCSLYMDSQDVSLFNIVTAAIVPGGRNVVAIGMRRFVLTDLNDVRKKACDLISEYSVALNTVNCMVTNLIMPKIEYKNDIHYRDYELDIFASNDDWLSQFRSFESQLNDTLDAFANACSDAAAQLQYFKSGEFDKSVIEIRQRGQVAREQARQQAWLEKQSVEIEVDGQPHHFTIEWQDVERPPCDPEQIRSIKTDGKVWLIIDNNDVLYRSEDKENWIIVQLKKTSDRLFISKVDIVNGMWVVMVNDDEGFYYSLNALTWEQSSFPQHPSSYYYRKTDDVIYFNGQWLWRFIESANYSYVEKGIIFDSTETSWYDKALIYCTDHLNGQWRSWEGTPSFAEGVTVESMRSLPGNNDCLLAFCQYDYLYSSRKNKSSAASFVSYNIIGKGWRTCTWGAEVANFNSIVVTRMSDKLMCFCSGELLTSDKGYDWDIHPDNERLNLVINNAFHLHNMSLFTEQYNNQVMYLSQDGRTIRDFRLVRGIWEYFCANDQGALSVYKPNHHETFLRAGRFICQPAG